LTPQRRGNDAFRVKPRPPHRQPLALRRSAPHPMFPPHERIPVDSSGAYVAIQQFISESEKMAESMTKNVDLVGPDPNTENYFKAPSPKRVAKTVMLSSEPVHIAVGDFQERVDEWNEQFSEMLDAIGQPDAKRELLRPKVKESLLRVHEAGDEVTELMRSELGSD
jgi:hypothetical protein